MSPSRYPIRRSLLVPLAFSVAASSACRRASDTAEARQTEVAGDLSRDVTRAWNPGAVAAVQGVDSGALRKALVARVARGRTSGLTEDHWDHVKNLYKRYGQSPLWLNEEGLIAPRVTALTTALLDAEKDGLTLSEYPFAEVAAALTVVRGGRATAEQLANADVLLTAAYAALGEDLMIGQVSPRSYKQDWHIDTRDASLDSSLVRGLVTDELDKSLAAMRPQDEGYSALREQFAHYRQLASNGGWGTVPAGRALKPGQRDSRARLDALRARLSAEGYAVASAPAPALAATSDGAAGTATAGVAGADVYDHALAGAVAQFQANHAIDVDSILGAGTVASMNKPVLYRIGQIAANLERYRWMPRTLGSRYVFVNVPAFRLTAYDSGTKALSMKVIVGENYQDKTTPVFADSMQYVVFRPYWNVTDDITAKEIWPKVAANPNYLAENEMETYKENGQTRVRQKPGDKNSLGFVKFLFPNDFNIYLHDTPQHSLFDKDVRAFSHGCIRVEKPSELAQWALGWPAEKVDAAMHSGADNQQITLPKKIPVYITYFTAYVDGGQLRFGNDLYDRDDELVTAESAVVIPDDTVRKAVESLRAITGT